MRFKENSFDFPNSFISIKLYCKILDKQVPNVAFLNAHKYVKMTLSIWLSDIILLLKYYSKYSKSSFIFIR